MRLTLLLFCALASPGRMRAEAVPEMPVPLREAEHDSVILSSLGATLSHDYAAAETLLTQALPESAWARSYFLGLNDMARFNDLGDTVALDRAERRWQTLHRLEKGAGGAGTDGERLALYRGLAALQLAYVARMRGRGLKAARLALEAVDRLSGACRYVEARAALALYDYYKAGLVNRLSWLPFVRERDRSALLASMEEHCSRSRYLSWVLRNSLVWLYFDAGNFHRGLGHIDTLLARHPGNRVLLQMRADFLFRLDDLAGARDLYESSRLEYAAVAPPEDSNGYVPVGYFSAVGNLVRIHAALGNREIQDRYAREWNSPQARKCRPWLPESLRSELARYEKK